MFGFMGEMYEKKQISVNLVRRGDW